jgi:hypothetical protein
MAKMRAKIGKIVSTAALAALVAAPLALGAGQADAANCSDRKLNGTLLGAAGGALLGGVVTHGSTGPIVGGLAGAVAGREVGRSGCARPTYRQPARAARPAPARNTAVRAPEPRREAPHRVYYDQYGHPIVARTGR